MTTINEAVSVRSTKMTCRGPEAGVIFPGVRSKEEMKDIGKDTGRETTEKCSLATGIEGDRICLGKTCLTTAAVKDLERDHVIETVVIHRPGLTITDARLPFPTGHVDHLHPMDLHVGRIGLKSEDVVYLLEDAGRRVIARVLRETKAVMAWDVSQRMGEVGTPRLLKTVADPWRVEEEFHPLQDSTQSVAEVPREGEESEVAGVFPTEVGRQGTGTKTLLVIEGHHGIPSADVKEIIHAIGIDRMTSHVIGTDVREVNCLQVEVQGIGKIGELGARDELLVHRATTVRMSRRRYRGKRRKSAGVVQMKKMKNGNTKKI